MSFLYFLPYKLWQIQFNMFYTQVSQNCERSLKKRKRFSAISVTTAICQLCKGEDVTPSFIQTATHVAMFVGDGHGGNEATKQLEKYSTHILHATLNDSIEAGMDLCLEKCQSVSAGAMVLLSLYSIKERTLEVISMGDASCTVYQDNALIHSQPHHSRSVLKSGFGQVLSSYLVNEKGEPLLLNWKEKVEELGIGMPSKKTPSMMPCADGQTISIEDHHAYFTWSSLRVAACSFVGHRNIPRLSPYKSVIIVPPGAFHLVMTSDGVSDVVHPEDVLLRSVGVTATVIVEESVKRWTEPFFIATEQDEYKHLNDNGHFIINPKPTLIRTKARWKSTGAFYPCQITDINEDHSVDVVFNDDHTNRKNVPLNEVRKSVTNSGGDDISVLVMCVG